MQPTASLIESLRHMGLAEPDEQPVWTPLTGGISSAIWRVDLRRGTVCVKQALPKLRVASDWRAPVERNQSEVAWFQTLADLVPHIAPNVLGIDVAKHLFAMEFFEPDTYPLWKAELRAGRADQRFAATVGQVLARIHSSTADRDDIAAAFSTDDIFRAMRLEPYLGATALRHPDLADQLNALAHTTAAVKRALVHGDISPKNILVGPQGPIFLDAECAWFGDPAFDLAFCLNHLLLKCLWTPRAADSFLACFDALIDAYLTGVTWEPRADIESRAAALLPGLFLARIDGQSPVEYITDSVDKDRVRRVARALMLARDGGRLAAIRERWAVELGLA